MLLEGSLSSTLFALGSQAEIYYGWKPLQLSDVSSGLRELKISAEINSMSCDWIFATVAMGKQTKKSQRLQFYSSSMIIFGCKKSHDTSGKEKGNLVSTEYNPEIWNADLQHWQLMRWHFDVSEDVRFDI